MKKFLFLFAILVLATSVSAQEIVMKKAALGAADVRKKVELPAGQYILGNSTDDEYAMYGSVPYPGDVLVGAVIYKSKYEKLKNCKALGIRFCVPEPVTVKNVTLFDSNVEPIKVQKPTKFIDEGWNYVEFDEPQELDPEGTFISYTYVQTETNYGICNWAEPVSQGFYTYLYIPAKDAYVWSDMSVLGYGAACIQLIVEAEVPDYDIETYNAQANPAAVGEEATSVMYFKSTSKKNIESMDYTVTIDGTSTSTHRVFTSPVESGVDKRFGVEIGYTVPKKAGNYPVTFTLDKVNGVALEDVKPYTFEQKVLTRVVQRHSVVEEFTGTGCGWCPRGWVGMEYLKENYPDKFIGIAVHQYNDTDPMFCNRYCNPGFGGAPSCVIDRKEGMDPYRGSTGDGIEFDLMYYSDIAPDVDVHVIGEYNEDKTKVNATVDTEFLIDCGKYTVAYVLTADGLKGKTSAWRQTNYYVQKTADESGALPAMPDLTKFCMDEAWGIPSVPLTYNDVLIGSSYSASGSHSNLGGSFPVKNAAGSKVTKTYSVAMPTENTALLSVLDYDKVYITALIIDADGKIANAARARVGDVEGINTVLAPKSASQSYDLQGRPSPKADSHSIIIKDGKKMFN